MLAGACAQIGAGLGWGGKGLGSGVGAGGTGSGGAGAGGRGSGTSGPPGAGGGEGVGGLTACMALPVGVPLQACASALSASCPTPSSAAQWAQQNIRPPP